MGRHLRQSERSGSDCARATDAIKRLKANAGSEKKRIVTGNSVRPIELNDKLPAGLRQRHNSGVSYCTFVLTERANPLHKAYHDNDYGFPIAEDDALFERLVLEINQAGLSWETILKKREGMREAYDQFSLEKVAAYGDEDIARLLADLRIIRNRLKVLAAIQNANTILMLRYSHGSFAAWLDSQHPKPLTEWTKLFKKTFRFTGGEIVNEFLMSAGYLPGAHDEDCPVHGQAIESGAKWATQTIQD